MFSLLAALVAGCGLALGLDGYSPATCDDGLQDGDESGVDCGGSCAACAVDAACSDGDRNNGESDIDCGGPCAIKCDVGKGCAVGADCQSLACGPGTCVAPACDDEVKNGEEADIDCGASCPIACKDAKACNVSADCESRVCEALTCSPNHVWSQAFDVTGIGFTRVTADKAENVILAGAFSGAAKFGSVTMTSAGGSDLFVSKLDSAGTVLWSKQFGDAADQVLTSVAVDSLGNIVVAGYFKGAINFGDALLTGSGGRDIFLAKLDPSGGPIWSKRFGDSADQEARQAAVDSSGNVVLTGFIQGGEDFGGGPLNSAGGKDVIIAKYAPDGGHVWSKRFGDAGYDQAGNASVIDGQGRITVTGAFRGGIDFGNGLLSTTTDHDDAFLVQLSADGTLLWTKQVGTKFQEEGGFDVDVASNGDLLLRGLFDGTLDPGVGKPFTSAGSYDLFLLKLTSSGAPVWAKAFGTTFSDGLIAIGDAMGPDGSVMFGGTFQGTLDVGAGPMSSPDNEDLFLARLDPAGEHLWSRSFGVPDDGSVLLAFARGAPGNAFLTGYFTNTIDLGGGPLKSGAGGALFLTKLRVP